MCVCVRERERVTECVLCHQYWIWLAPKPICVLWVWLREGERDWVVQCTMCHIRIGLKTACRLQCDVLPCFALTHLWIWKFTKYSDICIYIYNTFSVQSSVRSFSRDVTLVTCVLATHYIIKFICSCHPLHKMFRHSCEVFLSPSTDYIRTYDNTILFNHYKIYITTSELHVLVTHIWQSPVTHIWQSPVRHLLIFACVCVFTLHLNLVVIQLIFYIYIFFANNISVRWTMLAIPERVLMCEEAV